MCLEVSSSNYPEINDISNPEISGCIPSLKLQIYLVQGWSFWTLEQLLQCRKMANISILKRTNLMSFMTQWAREISEFNNSVVQRNVTANTTLLALFKIHFRSLFFDVKNRRQCGEVTAIPWDLLLQIC